MWWALLVWVPWLYLPEIVFFFKDTATPVIYTYGHTLSLHDALPICILAKPTTTATIAPAANRVARNTASTSRLRSSSDSACSSGSRYLGRRSEEHTSELQSLMRISYAVFCLKKKYRRR